MDTVFGVVVLGVAPRYTAMNVGDAIGLPGPLRQFEFDRETEYDQGIGKPRDLREQVRGDGPTSVIRRSPMWE
jgi:hypothetical protein